MQSALSTLLGLLIALLAGPIAAHDPPLPEQFLAESAVPAGDDDPVPMLVIDDVTVDESAMEATFTIYRIGKTKETVEFSVATSGIEATEDVDYVGRVATLSIKKDEDVRSETFTVPILEDAIDEIDETFVVTLSEPVGATLLKAEGIGTITDNDSAGIGVDQGDGVFLVEGDESGDSLTIRLHSQPTAEVAITLEAPPGQLIFDPVAVSFTPAHWDTPQEVAIAAATDGMDEEDPHLVPIAFVVDSADPVYSEIAVPPIVATVGDSDALLVSIDGPSAGALGIPARFDALVNAGGSGTVTYDWTVFLEGNAVATGSEASFQFTPDDVGPHIVQAVVGDDQGQNPAEFIEFTVLGDIGTSVFVQDIIWLAEEGITRGCNPPDNDEFCPDKTVTRGQMAAFLVRFLNLTAIDPTIDFTDTTGNIFEQDILRLATAGITRGCNADGTEFCPDNGVTRGQMAAFLVRAFGLTDNGGGDLFTDDDLSIFEDDIDKLATAGITRGCNPPDNTNFCPDNTVTRGQMAAFLHRAEGLLP